MMTVRYPDGQAITYNEARYLRYQASAWELYTADPAKGGAWVASIQMSAGALVEIVGPCSVTGGALTAASAVRYLAEHEDEMQRLTASESRYLSDVKRVLTRWHRGQRCWRCS